MKIIANPSAGRGRGNRFLEGLKECLERRRVRHEILLTRRPGHATELARGLVESGARRLCVMGGDGTISEAVNGIVPAGAELGIISVGRGNDVARSLGIPYNNIDAAVDVVLSGVPRPVDVGWERDRHFLSVLGFGFPALVARESNRMRRFRGSATFFVAVYKVLYRMEAFPIRLALDERTLELECTSVMIQNTPYTGGGLLMSPQSQVDDGYFDIVVVGPIGKLDLMLNFPRIYRGGHLQHSSFSLYRSRSVNIECPLPLEKMFDGELDGVAPVEARVLDRAIRIIVPRVPLK